jgi:nucleoside-diphosphate-sugar epimerase
MTRVLLTGGSGFVGGAVGPLLDRRGCTVWAPARADLAAPADRVVERVVAFAPDVVVHLAARFLAAHGPSDIADLVRSNVELGTVVAEAAVQSGARLVWTSTAWQHVDGRDYEPVSLYAATKQAFADIVRYYEGVRGLQAVDLTLFDTYGPRDPRGKVVAHLLACAARGEALQMSSGRQLIDLTYVDDVAEGIVHAALSDAPPRTAVLRSGQPITVRALVALVAEVTGVDLAVDWGARPDRPREMVADWAVGATLAGWAPAVPLREGLARCWEQEPSRAG